jgi:hypothetical protein
MIEKKNGAQKSYKQYLPFLLLLQLGLGLRPGGRACPGFGVPEFPGFAANAFVMIRVELYTRLAHLLLLSSFPSKFSKKGTVTQINDDA